MKKDLLLICIFLYLLILTGCRSTQKISEENTNGPNGADTQTVKVIEDVQRGNNATNDMQEPEIAIYDIYEITDEDKDYWEEAPAFFHDCLDNVETASSVAKEIFTKFQQEGYFSSYSLQCIKYQSDPGVWVFVFWDGSYTAGPGATFSMAIRKDNAQVVKMWVDE